MNAESLLSLFDRPIAFHPGFVRLTGSVNAALMLSQAVYWSRRTKASAEGWFYKSQDEWAKEIYLSRREQEGARKLLRATGFWKEKRKGNPAKMFYRIDLSAFNTAILGESSVQTSMAENAIYKSTEAPDKNGGNGHTPRARTELNTETTTETTPDNSPAARVFTCWKETLNHPKAHLDDKRRVLINRRLKDGYSVDDLCVAIRGCAESDFHMGKNSDSKVYDSIDLICRDAKRVDQFIAIAQPVGNGFQLRSNGLTSSDLDAMGV